MVCLSVWTAAVAAVMVVVGGVPQQLMYPFGPDVDDKILPPNDDVSSDEIALSVPIVFFDSTFDSIYVSMSVCRLAALSRRNDSAAEPEHRFRPVHPVARREQGPILLASRSSRGASSRRHELAGMNILPWMAGLSHVPQFTCIILAIAWLVKKEWSTYYALRCSRVQHTETRLLRQKSCPCSRLWGPSVFTEFTHLRECESLTDFSKTMTVFPFVA
ncbi:hypothetical protein BaRGS_00004633 [Batillaria attramentaria]|uniref:Uncharacterized protein n=1 Tax=Batillaria attramentaria TaxID=370345 RepID=A0ABD0LXN3_9CAEN